MKKITIITIILAFSVLLSESGFAQKYRKKEVSLISFKLNINNDYRTMFDEFSSYFNEPNNKEVNRIDNQIIYTAWDLISEKLRNEVGMLILPLNAYGKKFSYDNYGFPDIGINRAINKGQSKYYLKIDIEIGPEFSSKYITQSRPDSANQVIHLKENEFKPKVTINLTIYSDKGIIPVANCSGEAIVPNIITIDKPFFDGIINNDINPDQTTLYNLLEKASKKLIISVYSNK
ncbi:MAG: hypothetical protein AB7S48_10085 [Bacteroidales bacterium]